MTHFIYYLFVFLAGTGFGLWLAFRYGGRRALRLLSASEYEQRKQRVGL